MKTTSHKRADRREAEHGGVLAANAQKKRKHRWFSFKAMYRISGVTGQTELAELNILQPNTSGIILSPEETGC